MILTKEGKRTLKIRSEIILIYFAEQKQEQKHFVKESYALLEFAKTTFLTQNIDMLHYTHSYPNDKIAHFTTQTVATAH